MEPAESCSRDPVEIVGPELATGEPRQVFINAGEGAHDSANRHRRRRTPAHQGGERRCNVARQLQLIGESDQPVRGADCVGRTDQQPIAGRGIGVSLRSVVALNHLDGGPGAQSVSDQSELFCCPPDRWTVDVGRHRQRHRCIVCHRNHFQIAECNCQISDIIS
jgi:hypothetical protein